VAGDKTRTNPQEDQLRDDRYYSCGGGGDMCRHLIDRATGLPHPDSPRPELYNANVRGPEKPPEPGNPPARESVALTWPKDKR
jgi:hypothetical protein